MIGIGFIGVGGMGRHQANSFKQVKTCRIVAGSDPASDARGKFGEAHPGATLYSDHKDLLKDPKVDAVVIAVPTGHHRAMSVDALKAGRHVLVEKPMARTVAECYQMMRVAEEAGKVLMVAHCRRYDPDWGTLAKTYRAGTLGKQVLWRHCNAVRPGFAPWFLDDKLSGGPLMDGAIHNQDFANLLFGDADYAVGRAIKFDPKVTGIDTGSVVIQYKNGSQMMLSWSWVVNGRYMHDILGPKATWAFGASEQAKIPKGMRAHTLIMPDGSEKLVPYKPGDMYVNQAKHFLDCIARKTKCLSPGSESVKAVAVANAVLKAAQSGAPCKVKW